MPGVTTDQTGPHLLVEHFVVQTALEDAGVLADDLVGGVAGDAQSRRVGVPDDGCRVGEHHASAAWSMAVLSNSWSSSADANRRTSRRRPMPYPNWAARSSSTVIAGSSNASDLRGVDHERGRRSHRQRTPAGSPTNGSRANVAASTHAAYVGIGEEVGHDARLAEPEAGSRRAPGPMDCHPTRSRWRRGSRREHRSTPPVERDLRSSAIGLPYQAKRTPTVDRHLAHLGQQLLFVLGPDQDGVAGATAWWRRVGRALRPARHAAAPRPR